MGGAVYYDYIKPNIMRTNFIHNFAPYGNNFASYPVRVGLAHSTEDDEISLANVGPGIPIDTPLKLALLDMDDQVMNLDNINTINIFPIDPSMSSINGTNVVLLRNGIAEFDSISMEVSRQYRSANFSITSNTIDSSKVSSALLGNFKQKELMVHFRD